MEYSICIPKPMRADLTARQYENLRLALRDYALSLAIRYTVSSNDGSGIIDTFWCDDRADWQTLSAFIAGFNAALKRKRT